MYNQISTSELRKKIENKEELLIIDVRTPQEYTQFHLSGSLLIPLSELSQRLDEISEYKDKDIAIICRSGARSAVACNILSSYGFSKLHNVYGGLIQWRSSIDQKQ